MQLELTAAITAATGMMALASAGGSIEPRAASCSLMGDVINVSFHYPDRDRKIHGAGSFPVPSSDIDPRDLNFVSIDFTAASIIIQYKSTQRFEDSSFDGYVLTVLTYREISRVVVGKNTTVHGFDASRLTVTIGSIEINLEIDLPTGLGPEASG